MDGHLERPFRCWEQNLAAADADGFHTRRRIPAPKTPAKPGHRDHRSKPAFEIQPHLPRGTLREPLSGLRRCHVIVLNGRHEEGLNDPLEADIRNLHPDAKIFHCEQKIESMIPFSSWKETGGQSAPARNVGSAYLVAALGNPERFRQDVLRLGIEVRGTRFFADHFKLKHKDWLDCSDEANRRAADAMITTEKDAIKISRPPDFPLLVSVQSTEMSESEAFELVLKDSLQEQL